MNKVIGIILIVASLILGYFGVDQIIKSDKSIEVVGIQLEASDKAAERQGYIYTGLAVVIFAGGVYIITRK